MWMCPFKAEAKRAGLKIYFGGPLCKHGHTAGRRVANGQCVTCDSLEKSRRRKTPLGKIRGALSRSIGRAKIYGHNPIDPATIWAYPIDNRCELCNNLPKSGSLHSDHDHDTGVFRGWICYRCNSMLGNMGQVGPGKIMEYVQGLVYEFDHPK